MEGQHCINYFPLVNWPERYYTDFITPILDIFGDDVIDMHCFLTESNTRINLFLLLKEDIIHMSTCIVLDEIMMAYESFTLPLEEYNTIRSPEWPMFGAAPIDMNMGGLSLNMSDIEIKNNPS